ncbi:Endoribonuclease MazF9 [subsurface metagenome]
MTRSEIWLINLDPTIGAEIRRKRPAVIVSVDSIGVLPLRVIVPITEWKENYGEAPWMVHLNPDLENNLEKPSCADTFQVRSVSHRRFINRLGKVNLYKMKEIEHAISRVLGILSCL